MKTHYDKKKIPRETLAYLLDATGGPICVMIPISGWGVCLMSMFVQEDAFLSLGSNHIKSYLSAAPFLFLSHCYIDYCISFSVWELCLNLEE